MVFGSHHHQLLLKANRARIWSGAFLLCTFFFFATPKIPHSPKHHLFADMRNFLGIYISLFLPLFLVFLLLLLLPMMRIMMIVLVLSGVPNTLNVITNFPLLVVGVLGLVLCLHGNYFGIRCVCIFIFVVFVASGFPLFSFIFMGVAVCIHCSLRGEIWGWVLFYAAIAGAAFGSAYYHLKPDDARVLWDRLPVSFSFYYHLFNLHFFFFHVIRWVLHG